ncbi:MAG: hypothetical protein AVDCRST_MAG65-307, partial [uncultured Solirubrobacteraceae bacterium]
CSTAARRATASRVTRSSARGSAERCTRSSSPSTTPAPGAVARRGRPARSRRAPASPARPRRRGRPFPTFRGVKRGLRRAD